MIIERSQSGVRAELERNLNKLGIAFETGNDAARGGKTGYYVLITTKIID